MPNATILKKLESLENDSSIIETEDSETVLLLSEDATREVCLALDTLLNQIDPYNSERQEEVGYLYDDIMDVFAFERGSYVMLNSRNISILDKAFKERIPDDEQAFSNVVNTLETHTDEFTSPL